MEEEGLSAYDLPLLQSSDDLNADRPFDMTDVNGYAFLCDHHFTLMMQFNRKIKYFFHMTAPVGRKKHAGNLRWTGAFIRATPRSDGQHSC